MTFVQAGQRYLLVKTSDVWTHPSEESVRRFVETGLRDGGGAFARRLEELATRLSPRTESMTAVVEIVVSAITSGRLVLVRTQPPRPLMSEPQAVPLRELSLDPPAEPLRPAPVVEEPKTSWVSFEVVDQHGVVPRGQFRVTAGSTLDDGDLSALPLRYDDLPQGFESRVEFEPLRWSPDDFASSLPASAPTPTAEVRIPLDDLDYTKLGHVFRSDLALGPDAHHRIVIERPPRRLAVAASHGGFPLDSSFPLPATMSLVLFEHQGNVGSLFRDAEPKAGVYQVFAHGDTAGGHAHNKALTDQRAAVTAALLVADVDAFLAIARSESWGTDLHQVMLRSLEHDPGPIDGKVGRLTRAAIESFQTAYREGAFHRGHAALPRQPELSTNGRFDDDTIEALLEAYVTAHSPHLSPERLHPTHAEVGCSSFNHVSGTLTDRRVSLVVHAPHEAVPTSMPCQAGDAGACPALDGDGPCLWYQTHVEDAHPDDVEHHHYRLSWLPLANGNILLSALTTVPDDEEVEFEVFAATEPVDGPTVVAASMLGDSLGASVATRPIHGVAHVQWTPPADFAPGPDGRFEHGEGNRRVPVFRVRHARTGVVAHDSWPSRDVAVLFDRPASGKGYEAHPGTRIELVGQPHGYRAVRAASEALPFDEYRYILRFEGVPEKGSYSLFIYYRDSEARPLFEDIPYAELVRSEDHPAPAPFPRRDTSPSPPDAALDGEDEIDVFPVLDPSKHRSSRWIY